MADNKYSPNPRKYSKTNLVELIEIITPEIYQTEDLKLSGTEVNPLSQVINSHLNVANNISTVIPLSAVQNTQTSTLNSITGIAQYFVKQNRLTNISPFDFESKILLPLSSTLANFDTSAEFNTYLSGTLLPMIIPAAGVQNQLNANITTLSSLTNSTDPSSVHNYLVDALGWMYFLNTSADGGLSYSPSSFVLDSLNSLYLGNSLETIDGIKGLVEYLWRNNETCSFGSYIPADFVSGVADGIVDSSSGVLPTYTSGTQKLEALQTLVDVVYSPLYIDEQDYTVKDAFTSYIDANIQLDNRSPKGPYRKFLNLLGYSTADISDQIENIELIYDIENVKAEHLIYIADLIGFKLRGNSASKWRHQLRIAMDLYKSKGTLRSIQVAINALITDSVFDLSGKVEELWESYLPFLIWYALGTESPEFKDLTTWTLGRAEEAGVYSYSTSSLEENLKMVVDSILFDLYKAFPENFTFHGQKFNPPTLKNLDIRGCEEDTYTIIGDPQMKPFHFDTEDSNGYLARKQDAKLFGESLAFEAATGLGPLGWGVYMAGLEPPTDGSRPVYLKPTGDLNFLFSYREKVNYPVPPFDTVRYYRDCTVTADMVSFLVERLKCFNVKDSFADEVGEYILSGAVTDETDLGSLNEMLMLFSSVQVPPNFNDVMLSTSDYEKNLLNLWNGKSSHLFINFKDTDFDFSKTTLEGDGKYALFEASRVIREFAPGHAITRVNLTGSASEPIFDISGSPFSYLGLDKDDTRALYTSASVLGNFEWSGAAMCFDSGGGDANLDSSAGRNGSNTFKRPHADQITDSLLSGVNAVVDLGSVPRRALRRRNLKYLLPLEGYYDRTGFNGPVSYDPSTFEPSFVSSLGELTLGYVASAGKFHPVCDPVDPTGVWEDCEKLNSTNTFSGIDTSATFPYRGLHTLGSNNKRLEVSSATARYVDRGQTPKIYGVMHELYEAKARHNAGITFSKAGEEVNTYSAIPTVSQYLADEKDNILIESLSISGYSWYHYPNDKATGTLNNAIAPDGTTTGDLIEVYFPRSFGVIQTDIPGSAPDGGLTPEENQVDNNDDYYTFRTCMALGDGTAAADDEVRVRCRVIDWDYDDEGKDDKDPIGESTGIWLDIRLDTGTYTIPPESPHKPSDFYALFGDSQVSFTKMPSGTATLDWYELKVKIKRNPFCDFIIMDFDCVPDPWTPVTKRNFHIWGTQIVKGEYVEANVIMPSPTPIPTPSMISDSYWKEPITSLANISIADGFVLNSFADYENFKFGSGIQRTHRDYCKYFAKHPLGLNEVTKTGGNIIAQVFGKGLFNCDFDIAGSAVGNMIAPTVDSASAINITNVWNEDGNGTFSAYTPAEAVIPLSGSWVEGNAFNADWRNPAILSGIEFCDISGAPRTNQFTIFKLDPSTAVKGMENVLINNTVIKCKSVGALPRMRFDLSAYGARRNYFIKDHKFKLNIKALVAEENSPVLGGGYLGVWIHTQPVDGIIWSWTPNQKWEVIDQSRISIPIVKNSLCHRYKFELNIPNDDVCIGNSLSKLGINNKTLSNLKSNYFENFEIEFDTRNFTIHNNSEYLDVIPIEEKDYKITEQVNRDDTNYTVEVFFVPNDNPDKYLLIDSIELQDLTQRENSAVGTGYGIETSGIPHRPFAKEDKIYLNEDQLITILKFYNGLIGQGTGVYATNLASRDATITSGTLELSGGSRLNYRTHPDWTPGVTKVTNFENYTNVEFDN